MNLPWCSLFSTRTDKDDVVDENTIYEVLYDLGWPRVIRGRTELMAQFRGYAESIEILWVANS
jgi:hypothetical protein